MSSYPGDQRWADEQHAKRCNEAQKDEADLSRALGEIDAAHVDLDRQGVTRCQGEALQDRIARFGDTAQSLAEEANTAIAGLQDELARVIREHAGCPQWDAYMATSAALRKAHDNERDLSAKLAAAERREAEKDQRIEKMASQFEADATNAPDRSERLSLRFCAKNLRALASPSTPSDGRTVRLKRTTMPDGDERVVVVPSTPSPAPSPKQEPTT